MSVSDDGLHYTQITTDNDRRRDQTVRIAATGRYVAITMKNWSVRDAGLISLSLSA